MVTGLCKVKTLGKVVSRCWVDPGIESLVDIMVEVLLLDEDGSLQLLILLVLWLSSHRRRRPPKFHVVALTVFLLSYEGIDSSEVILVDTLDWLRYCMG